MSDKKPPETAEEGAPPKKKKLLLFIIIGVLVVILGAVAAVLLLKKPPPEEGEDGEEPPAKHEKAKKKADGAPGAIPVFVKLDPFTVKLQTDQQEAYLQATPELQVFDAPVADRVKQFTPAIRHKITLVLMSRKSTDLASPKGVQSLANELRFEVNKILDGPKVTKKKGKKGKQVEEEEESTTIPEEADPGDSVQAVLFTQFIIQ